jgi:hypothetical protein
MPRSCACLAAAFFLMLGTAAAQTTADADRDGLADSLEGQLLEQFRPTFMVARDVCDGLPAELAAGEAAPRVLARNGTIYGQATPHAGGAIELHYFHLWARDCGRNGHPGDIEHVSALLRQAASGAWQARYWYAAAHEGTVCDRCMAARAPLVKATTNGPAVWISSGKHASYFGQKLCNGGCGGDRCVEMRATPPLPIVNLGEPNAPLNGATWASSPALAAHLSPEFDAALLAQLDASPADSPFRVTAQTKGMQRTISVSNTTLGGLETAETHTENGLGTAERSTGNALQRSYRAVKTWLRGSK